MCILLVGAYYERIYVHAGYRACFPFVFLHCFQGVVVGNGWGGHQPRSEVVILPNWGSWMRSLRSALEHREVAREQPQASGMPPAAP